MEDVDVLSSEAFSKAVFIEAESDKIGRQLNDTTELIRFIQSSSSVSLNHPSWRNS